MKRKHGNTPKEPIKRVSVTLHFTPGVTDDDVFIAMLKDVARGDRSYKIKKLLLGRLPDITALNPNYAASLEDVTARLYWLQEAMHTLPQSIEEMLSKMTLRTGGLMASPAPLTNNPMASDEDLKRREKRMKKNEWS